MRRLVATSAAILLSLLLFTAQSAQATVLFVDHAATGSDDGSSWTDAFVDLQDALAAAMDTDEIWVAAGVYRPTDTLDQLLSFDLPDGVAIYGGFTGTESMREQRDFELNVTVLSGDIGVASPTGTRRNAIPSDTGRSGLIEAMEPYRTWRDAVKKAKETGEFEASILDDTDNSEHVVRATDVGPNTRLDGFTIRDGYCDDEMYGGGIKLVNASPALENLVVTFNTSFFYGAGIACLQGSSPALTNVQFDSNWCAFYGGGVFNEDGCPSFVGVDFVNNSGEVGGGMLSNNTCNMTLLDVTFEGNFAESGGGGLSAGPVDVVGGVFRDNLSIGYSGGGASVRGGRFVNVLFDANVGTSGGGLSSFGDAELTNVAFIDNEAIGGFDGRGSAFLLRGDQNTLTNLTVARNDDYADQVITLRDGTTTFVNSIVWGNANLPGSSGIYLDGGTARFSHCLIEGSGGSGANWDSAIGTDLGDNIDTDPHFTTLTGVSNDPYDLRLRLISPAIDTGMAFGVYPPNAYGFVADLAGSARLDGHQVDMGAYEYSHDGCFPAQITIGSSWDGLSLQDIFDAEFGVGAIDAAADYSGTVCGDPIQAFWADLGVESWLVREIENNGGNNVFGWYAEDFNAPIVDGVSSGVIFTGPATAGATALVQFDHTQRFGFYLDPNAEGDGTNAPQPERFFTNRIHNDEGPDGSGAAHQPAYGDVQCLIYDVTERRGGVPTYILAWEDADTGSSVSEVVAPGSTDNDFNDLVVEVRASSPVSAVVGQIGLERWGDDVVVSWEVSGTQNLDHVEVERRVGDQPFVTVATLVQPNLRGEWIDRGVRGGDVLEYRVTGVVHGHRFRSASSSIAFAPGSVGRAKTRLVGAAPNPFNPMTTISYELQDASRGRLEIFDARGRHVITLMDRNLPAGRGEIVWQGRDASGASVSSGVYLCRLTTDRLVDTQRLVLLR